MASQSEACAVCGEYIGRDQWIVACGNKHAGRVPLHEACKDILVKARDQTDRFDCPVCKMNFTPDSFPFVYGYDRGAMGLGSGFWKMQDQVCPGCKMTIPADSFKLCAFCGGAVSSKTSIQALGPAGVVYYHAACNPKSIRSIGWRMRRGAAGSKGAGREFKFRVPWWVWAVAIGGIVAVWLIQSK
jgi:hypothetical protein